MLKIKVTKTHIKKGKKGSDTSCPVALALIEQAYPDYTTRVQVASDSLWLRDSSQQLQHHFMPRSVVRFVSRFDQSKKVRPFNFILDLSK